MGAIIGLGLTGVVITMIGLTLRLNATNMEFYFLFVCVAAIGFLCCFYSGILYGRR